MTHERPAVLHREFGHALAVDVHGAEFSSAAELKRLASKIAKWLGQKMFFGINGPAEPSRGWVDIVEFTAAGRIAIMISDGRMYIDVFSVEAFDCEVLVQFIADTAGDGARVVNYSAYERV